MKVIVSVGGRFYAFSLAQQLLKRNYLERLITSYPKFEVAKYGIPKHFVRSILIKEILERGWSKMPQFVRTLYNPQFFITEIFDKSASRQVIASDIFIGFANQSLHQLRRAKQLGAITVLERASSHIEYQHELLREEYGRFNIPIKPNQVAQPKIK